MHFSLTSLLLQRLTLASHSTRSPALTAVTHLLIGRSFSTPSGDTHPSYVSKHSSFVVDEIDSPQQVQPDSSKIVKKLMVELAHPWPEWAELMSIMVQQNYFDHKRRNEDLLVHELGQNFLALHHDFNPAGELGVDFSDSKAVLKACLSFGNDRFDILRALSRRDIQALVGRGCPNFDKMALLSSKLLRKYVNLEEGDVCSNCAVRNSCEKAFLVPKSPKDATTSDVMRVLLQYANGAVTNEPLRRKPVKHVVKKLLGQIAKLGSITIDPNLPRPVVRVAPKKKQKQQKQPPSRKSGRRQGDWHCSKCGYVNFSKNSTCLQCDAKARNPASSRRVEEDNRQLMIRRDIEKKMDEEGIANLWNFNFEDNESDGADVAAFECADSADADRQACDAETEAETKTTTNPQNLGFDDFGDWNEHVIRERRPRVSERAIATDFGGADDKSKRLSKKLGKRERKKRNLRYLKEELEDEMKFKSSHVADARCRSGHCVARRPSYGEENETLAFSDTDDEFKKF